LCCLICF
jgi:hypothetical protein